MKTNIASRREPRSQTIFTSLFALALLAAFLAAPATMVADSASYTFEAPQFSAFETTLMTNKAPNNSVDPLGAAFLATFSGAPNTTGVAVSPIPLPNDVLMSGQYLLVPETLNETLTITFNMQVTTLDLDFVKNGAGFLRLITSSGDLDQPALVADGPGGLLGGHASFSSAVPFTSVQVECFDAPGVQDTFALDNMVVTVVPEPTTWAMLAAGGASLLALSRRKRSL